MHSDQMVNIFFQEWAPLFPVLHRPAFLTLYEQYTANSSNVQDKKSLAQLNLVFAIASLSSEVSIDVVESKPGTDLISHASIIMLKFVNGNGLQRLTAS